MEKTSGRLSPGALCLIVSHADPVSLQGSMGPPPKRHCPWKSPRVYLKMHSGRNQCARLLSRIQSDVACSAWLLFRDGPGYGSIRQLIGSPGIGKSIRCRFRPIWYSWYFFDLKKKTLHEVMFIYLVGQKYLWQVIWFSLVNILSTQKSPRVSDFQARWGIFFGKQQHGSDCWHWEPWGALGPPPRTRRRSDKPDHQLSASGNAWFRMSLWFHLFVRRRWLTMNFTQCSSRLVRLCRQKSWGIKVLATVTATALCTINCPRMPPKQLPLSMDCRSFWSFELQWLITKLTHRCPTRGLRCRIVDPTLQISKIPISTLEMFPRLNWYVPSLTLVHCAFSPKQVPLRPICRASARKNWADSSLNTAICWLRSC